MEARTYHRREKMDREKFWRTKLPFNAIFVRMWIFLKYFHRMHQTKRWSCIFGYAEVDVAEQGRIALEKIIGEWNVNNRRTTDD